jgi:SsrA-binding protein
LVNKIELRKIAVRTKDSGITLVPLQLYFKDGKAKIEVAIAKGKKAHDKRGTLMEQQATRDINRELSRRQSGKDS